MTRKKSRSTDPNWSTLDIKDKDAVDRFVAAAVKAGQKGAAEAVARLEAAGIPVPVGDDSGRVVFTGPSASSGASKARKPQKHAHA
jgi:hypothetical protein